MKNTNNTLDFYLRKEKERKEKAREASRRYYEKNKRNLALTKGISAEAYEEMKKNQSGLCAICCAKPQGRLCVDHNHETGEIRGLLCRRCNAGIGLLYDDPVIVDNASAYLRRYAKDE